MAELMGFTGKQELGKQKLTQYLESSTSDGRQVRRPESEEAGLVFI